MNLKTLESKEIMPGFHGKMVHGENLTWAFWSVEKDAVVPEHHHPHEQIMHVVSGEFEFTLKGETKIYHEGDVVHIPSNSCLLYTSPSPRDATLSRMPSSA